MGSKIGITRNFDRALKELDIECDHFVTYSSISAGLGNAGQTNYGYANSCLDTLIKHRVAEKKPALSIQWGAIGGVGVLARSGAKLTGVDFLAQMIDSCLTELEKLLVLRAQGVHMIFETPKRTKPEGDDSDADAVPLFEKVCNIIGAKNVRDSETLENLGVDSLQYMEIQNAVKKVTGQKIPVDKLQKISIKGLKEMSEPKKA